MHTLNLSRQIAGLLCALSTATCFAQKPKPEIIVRVTAAQGDFDCYSNDAGAGCYTHGVARIENSTAPFQSNSGGGAPDCQPQSRYWNPSTCAPKWANTNNSFSVYTSDQIDTLTTTLNDRVDDIGVKVVSLNKRMAVDEAGLPGQIDQFAVAKLLDKIAALEARLSLLEKQLAVSKP